MQWARLKSTFITFGVFAFPIFLAYWQIEERDGQRLVRPHHKYLHHEKSGPAYLDPDVEQAAKTDLRATPYRMGGHD